MNCVDRMNWLRHELPCGAWGLKGNSIHGAKREIMAKPIHDAKRQFICRSHRIRTNSDLSFRLHPVFVIARSEATWQSRVGSTVFEIATAASGLAMTQRGVRGKIAESGTPEEIFEHPQNARLQEFLSKVIG